MMRFPVLLKYPCLACYLTGLVNLSAGTETDSDSSFYLKNGDTVVFYGDSITQQRLYTTLTETFVLTRFPDMKVDFVHSGWSGDSVRGGGGGSIDVRLKRDVIDYQPDVVTVMLGMNDGVYKPFDTERAGMYRSGLAADCGDPEGCAARRSPDPDRAIALRRSQSSAEM